jgi:N-glycosylase/DNA lyase
MDKLVNKIQTLKTSEVKRLIEERLLDFAEIKNQPVNLIFKELCFCIMTANCSAAKCIEIHENMGDGFLILSETELAERFKDLGYRFPNIRSKYIFQARDKISDLDAVMKSGNIGNDLREWIVKNIKGIGYKEGSHFLRNIGYEDYAIIDFHIIDVLVKHNYIEKPKSLTKTKYLEIENVLKNLANNLGLNLAELDLYLWYLETGQILK